MNMKFRRSSSKKVIAGVCGGLSEVINLDVNIIRLLAVVLTMVTSGIAALAYLLVWLLVPEEGSGTMGADRLYQMYGDYRKKVSEPATDSDQPKDVFDPYTDPEQR